MLNSGFTFREYDYLNNARQVPKLPDFAVLDVDVPVSPRAAGGVVAAGFYRRVGATARSLTAGTSDYPDRFPGARPPTSSATGAAVVVEGFSGYSLPHETSST